MSNYELRKYKTLTNTIVSEINKIQKDNPTKKIVIQIPNTKGVSSSLLGKIDSRISIRIAGGYDEDRVRRLGKKVYKNGETGQYYTDAVIYSKDEAFKIVSAMEDIETGFEGQNFSDFEKIVYIYEKLKSQIMYDPKYEKELSSEIRSLRGFIRGKTVCAGYALMFKEMLDRQNIKCYYVQGKARSSYEDGGHAWNIITINGKSYPVDLTWDNSKFRSGNFKTHNYLGQDVKNFKAAHIPDDDEPCKNMAFSEINPDEIKKVYRKVNIERDYRTSTFYGCRDDGTMFIVAQIGNHEKGWKKYYRYFYADIDEYGKLYNQTILFGDANISKYMDFKNFGKKTPDGFAEALKNVLFSKENIADSLSKGTQYIGNIIKNYVDDKPVFIKELSDISKSNEDVMAFHFPTKCLKRSDGTSFVIQQMNNNPVKTFHIFERVQKNGKKIIQRNIVYSEHDIMNDSRLGIANDFLSRDRLDRKVKESRGYIGYYDKNGLRRYDPKLLEYYKKRNSSDLKDSIKRETILKIPNSSKVQNLTSSEVKSKINWINNYISNYGISEKPEQYEERIRNKNNYKSLILDTIRTGKFTDAINYNGKNISSIIPNMASLLIEAKELTNYSNTNILNLFVNIPQVNEILLQIKESEEYKRFCNQAVVNSARKRRWINKFISNYKATESASDYNTRVRMEDQDIQAVVESLEKGSFTKANNYRGYNISMIIPILARYLIAADNLTILQGTTDYVKKFSNIPQIHAILYQIQRSDEYKKICQQAERNNFKTKNKKTLAEEDKALAQKYLEEDKATIEQKLSDSKKYCQNEKVRIQGNIDELKRKKLALIKVLARQSGKIPGTPYWDRKMSYWVCEMDTKRQNEKIK